MLQLRACCEHCAKALPASSDQAMICSFECTFCIDCVESVLSSVCPNCGGNFQPRPIRPAMPIKNNNSLLAFPAQTDSYHKPVDLKAHRELVQHLETADGSAQ